MVNYCCIPGCRNKDKDGIILYRIPKHLLDDFGKYPVAFNHCLLF